MLSSLITYLCGRFRFFCCIISFKIAVIGLGFRNCSNYVNFFKGEKKSSTSYTSCMSLSSFDKMTLSSSSLSSFSSSTENNIQCNEMFRIKTFRYHSHTCIFHVLHLRLFMSFVINRAFESKTCVVSVCHIP